MKIHQVKTRLVNSYVIEYRSKLLVMDVAVRCHRYVLGFIEKELRRDIHDVSTVVCSHDDPDHMGGVKALAAICHAQIAIPLAAGAPLRKLINDPSGGLTRGITSMREMFRARAWDMYVNPQRTLKARRAARSEANAARSSHDDVHGKEGAKLHSDFRLKHGDHVPNFSDWIVVHTPGHSWDSVCFYHRESQSLLSGDTLLGSGKKGHLVVPAIYSNRAQTLETLSRLRALPITSVYPGHGSIIRGDHLIPTSV